MLGGNILKITDFEKSLKEIKELHKKITSNLDNIGITPKKNNPIFDFVNQTYRNREDINFRIRSIIYFVELIIIEERNCLNELNKTSHHHVTGHVKIWQLVDTEITIFDSILYNLSSVFDYIAVLSGVILPLKKNLKWNGLYKWSLDKENKDIGQKMKDSIIDKHKKFVDSIFSHRSYLIHKSTDESGFNTNFDILKGEWEMLLFTPKKFIKKFPTLNALSKNNKLTINYSLHWIVIEGLKLANELIIDLKHELD